MKIKLTNGQLRPMQGFKIAGLGYFIGTLCLFLPFFALILLLTLATGAPMMMNGEAVSGAAIIPAASTMLIMLPFGLAIQSVIFGLFIALGLWLYSRFKPITIETNA